MIKKIFIGIICVILLIGVCASLEKMATGSNDTPITDAYVEGIAEGFQELTREVKEFFSNMFSSIKENLDSKQEIGEISADELPSEAKECYDNYEKDNWNTTTDDMPGSSKAGGTWKNKKGQLPTKTEDGSDITYKEYDAQPSDDSGNRGTQRFVRGSDGSVYYTDDHYKTFYKVK